MKLQYENHIGLLSESQDNGSHESDWTLWQATDEDEDVAEDTESVEDEDPPESVLTEPDPEMDNLVAQYFGDVRQFELLDRSEEKMLWERIESLRQRARRALYLSPVCLPTLQQLWQDVARGDCTIHDVVVQSDTTADHDAAAQAPLEAAILSLQDVMQGLQRLANPKRQRVKNPQTRRTRRQARIDLWYEWIAICESLHLQPGVYETIRDAVDAALMQHPDDLALRAARRGWRRATDALDEAKGQMLRANLRLVIYVAKRFRNDDVPFLDLIQEGNIGLMRALEKFDASRGLKFVTYAHWWVRQAIGRAVIEQSRTVRLPTHVVERKNKLRMAETKLWQVCQRQPNNQELSAELGWAPKDVQTLRDTRQVMMCLHEPVSENGNRFEEIVEDEQSVEPDLVVAQQQLQDRLADCLRGLPEREAHILRLRFGLDTDRDHSLKEIGDLYGLSRERIRQLETSALNKLRSSTHGALLADFMDIVSI